MRVFSGGCLLVHVVRPEQSGSRIKAADVEKYHCALGVVTSYLRISGQADLLPSKRKNRQRRRRLYKSQGCDANYAAPSPTPLDFSLIS
jgi:hypothetical protein